MTHPTLTPASLADTLAALARIKAVDADAPGLDPRTTFWLNRMTGHDVRPKGSVMNQAECESNALANLLDVCMGVMRWWCDRSYMHEAYVVPVKRPRSPLVWSWSVEIVGDDSEAAMDRAPTHLSAACAVVCAIADVVGEKEGATDE